MMIQVGDKIPSKTVALIDNKGHADRAKTDELFAGKKVVLFAVPGAFTPTCSDEHLPGFITSADKIKAKGVDMIACVAVNDSFVVAAWAKTQNAEEITMLADGGASFTKELGLDLDTRGFGGIRSRRYSMIIEDGVVTTLNAEEATDLSVSSAAAILEAL
jgi:peroxiredoxin